MYLLCTHWYGLLTAAEDVMIAYILSSRLFLYYHSLANQPAGDRSYFPLFAYLESQSRAKWYCPTSS